MKAVPFLVYYNYYLACPQSSQDLPLKHIPLVNFVALWLDPISFLKINWDEGDKRDKKDFV
ncbi:hypothetical protein JW926_10675, partial [Candidatus Sumerlaeota bacterium]|nr:hypothetical protein [Candidatus Sumerlaeota bacterium]